MNWLEKIKDERDKWRELQDELPKLRKKLVDKIWETLGTRGFKEEFEVTLVPHGLLKVSITAAGTLCIYKSTGLGFNEPDGWSYTHGEEERTILKALLKSLGID